MDEIAIKKRLYNLALSETTESIEREIAIAATESNEPIQYLHDMYRNNGLKYDLQNDFFETYVEEIISSIDDARLKNDWEMNTNNYRLELSFLSFQLTLEKMMIHFGILSTEESFFAEHDILDVHSDKGSGSITRYGISDIVIPSDQTPSKYVQVRNEQGKVLTEAEVYFIEDESEEHK